MPVSRSLTWPTIHRTVDHLSTVSYAYLSMERRKPCACTNIRSCLLCNTSNANVKDLLEATECMRFDQSSELSQQTAAKLNFDPLSEHSSKTEFHVFCPDCRCVHRSLKVVETNQIITQKEITSDNVSYQYDCVNSVHEAYHCTGHLQSIALHGIEVIKNFITKEEEVELINNINSYPWKLSQSGRRKQDFGPKANFKRKKVNIGNFVGLPKCSHFLVERMKRVDALKTFEPVEVCHLEYCPDRGSSIDPHKDDEWLWGERLVTLHLVSGTFLTLSHESSQELIVKIPMPARSLLILSGEARYDWKHSIAREDISHLRIAVTFRELARAFQSGGEHELEGQRIAEVAKLFKGSPQYLGPSENFPN